MHPLSSLVEPNTRLLSAGKRSGSHTHAIPDYADTVPVFIISLKNAATRQVKISGMLERLHLKHEFFWAKDKNALTPQDRKIYNATRRRLSLGKDLYDGELACIISHKAVLEHIVNNKIQHAIVMEDDCIVRDAFPALVQSLLRYKSLWHLVRFFGDEKHLQRKHRKIKHLFEDYWLARIGTSPGEAHCYLIDYTAALRLTQCMARVSTPIDILMGQPWKTGLSVMTVLPKVSWQDKSFISGIETQRFSNTLHVSGLEKVFFHLIAPLAQLYRNIAKRFYYYAAWPKDYLRRKDR